MVDGLLHGFEVALTPSNILYVLAGVLIGMIIGVLPGLGPVATIALLLPITYELDTTGAVIMLAGIYYGSMYGGTITSVLLRLPGESASVVTTFDGYQMAKQGRAGPALGIAAVGSFAGGMLAVVGLTVLSAPLADLALKVGPPEYVAIALLGLVLVVCLGSGSVLKSACMAVVGLLLATVGQDLITGSSRFTFGQLELFDGFDFVTIAMGLFGVAEILNNLEKQGKTEAIKGKIKKIWPSRSDFRNSAGAIVRGSGIGFVLGVLPGGGGVLSSLTSYAVEKRRAKDPSRFGRGAIEGVAGPETANNASSTSAFIPLLTLGIPPNVVLALIYGALLVQGITPGPQLVDENPDIFWGVIVSMCVGNLFLLLLNIPLVGAFVQLLRIRVGILGAFALLITMVGVYSINNSPFEMWVVLFFGIVGWLMRKVGFEPGPLVLAFVLGPILERSFRQSMLLSGGDPSIFVTRPFSLTVLAIVVLAVVWVALSALSRRRGRGGPALAADANGEYRPGKDEAAGAEHRDDDQAADDRSAGR
ncbi:tripartite tricarboxylate transporter permease [Actinomadura sp. LOL_016]|uniref:tripartite tricarboxylate transporter permease n=1 Tax=unclassified Actinomadura TaxID=2626254 RepID=UPI003A7FBFC3